MDNVIKLFNENNVRYLLIGGQAVRLEGMPRFSMDWDFYIPPKDMENINLVNKFLGDELDVPLQPLGEHGESFVQTYQVSGGVIQFHLGGPGLPDFDEAEKRAVVHETETGVPVRCICGLDLLAAKKGADRPGDRIDIEFLEKKNEMGLLSHT